MSDKLIQRAPVISVMGHVDHGKSAILDYIRKTNVVAKEAGGITQHVSAYEVEHNYEGQSRKITFLDTPGHEAFREIRRRGASVADIAILVVAADDGVKTQTLDALSAIKEAKIPFVVAINKIDLPNANIQKVQGELIENEVYLEGMGGDVPWVQVSAKTGEGIDSLLDTLLLLADMQELKADPSLPAEGVVIESKKEGRRGISATLIIKSGTLKSGDFVVAEDAWAPVRIFEDFMGNAIKEASFSSPVQIVGFNEMPKVGVMFKTLKSKKEAEVMAKEAKEEIKDLEKAQAVSRKDKFAVPVIVCADTVGSKEAIIYELAKLENEKSYFKVLSSSVGDVNKDLTELAYTANAKILAFNVKTDAAAREFARQYAVDIENFNIIYNLADFAKNYLEEASPKIKVEEEVGLAKIIKIFSESKKGYVLGGKVKSGKMQLGSKVKVLRRDMEIGQARIKTLQSNKQDKEQVLEGEMYGAMLETSVPLAEGDTLVVLEEVEK